MKIKDFMILTGKTTEELTEAVKDLKFPGFSGANGGRLPGGVPRSDSSKLCVCHD
jgi:hypothetical protein